MDEERFERQKRFILEVDKEKKVLRQTHISGYERQEDDAEHAWHMALMTYLLKEYANEPFDLAKTMAMTLIHDIVEIDAGDTYAYDAAAHKDKAEREGKAADRIFGILPDDQRDELKGLWMEFEANETPEAHFAHAMDNFQPVLLNDANDGRDWVAHGVKRSQPSKRNEVTRLGSEDLYRYAEKLFDKNTDEGHLKQE